MPKYLCLQRNLSKNSPTNEKPSPAQMQEMYAKFNAWRERFQANLTDMGGRLGAGKLVTSPPDADGPFVEVKELVGGYMVVTAANADEAADIARECPGLVRPGSGVEVIEIHTAG
ncbi:MAG: YciI family protein [Polyangiaceae bacterium]